MQKKESPDFRFPEVGISVFVWSWLNEVNKKGSHAGSH